MKTKDTPKQYVIYSRKSKFTGKGESIENQIELCRQYIAMHFGEDAAENVLVYEDEGFSGGNLERPQFKKMMKDSQKIAFAAIVVYRLDRISRNIGDFAKLIEDLGDRHIDFISIREQFDTSSPMGRAMMYIASVFSQLERETIAERIRDNMHELSKTGRWLGGTTPTGYASESLSSVTVDGKVKKACKLKPIPEEIQLVKTIFEVFMETGSLSKTDQYLLEHRCVTKRGKQFTRFAIRGILTNPVYMIADETAYQYLKENNVDLFAERSEFDGEHGIMAYNRTLQRPGKANQIRPMEEWIVAVGKHPGIIAGSDWVRVQAMLDVNKSKSYRRPRSNVALLSGLLRCGECGDYMRPKLTNRQQCGRRADLHLHVLHQGAQPRHGLLYEKLQRQHAGRQDHRGDPQAVRRQGDPYPAAGADQEGHQRQQGGLRRRACAAPGETRRDGRAHQAAGGIPVRCQRHLREVRHGADRRAPSGERDPAAAPCRAGSPHRTEPDAPSGVCLPSGNDRVVRQRGGFCHAGGKTPPAAHHRQERWSGTAKMPMFTSLRRMERRICHPLSNLCIR